MQGVGIETFAGEVEALETGGIVFLKYSPFGSSFLIARKAVGAVNRLFTLCWEMTRQKAPASGVPIGLPS